MVDRPTPPRRWLLSIFVVPLGVALMLLEEYLWRGLKALMARLGRLAPIARIEARIAALPPAGAAAVFLIPGALALPFKLAAVWAMTQGHLALGLLVLLTAKLIATALFARLYTLCKPALMTVAWFVRLHDAINRAKAWAHAKLNSFSPWRLARRLLARLRHKAAGIIGQLRGHPTIST